MRGDEHHNFPYKTFDEWIVKWIVLFQWQMTRCYTKNLL
jgi:hypothetical protein